MATELAAWSGCPSGAGERIAWGALLERFEWLRALEGCPQDPVYHAEGDVLVHTKMVCERLLFAFIEVCLIKRFFSPLFMSSRQSK